MDKEGYVSISVISRFNRVRALSQEIYTIKEALRNSTVIEMRGDRVRQRVNWNWVVSPDTGKDSHLA